jgi:predicted phosphohydrolase
MTIFGHEWADHMARLEALWRESVAANDTVLVVGDIDWALHLNEAMETLDRLAGLPGDKILVRGNHDYWWSSKTTGKLRKALPPSIRALHNDALQAEGFNICGTKGSPVPGSIEWTEENAKLLNREELRLRMSLEARDEALPTIVGMHYPPFYVQAPASSYRSILEEAGVACVVYGHLHGSAASSGPAGHYGGVEYCLVAGDAVGFQPVLIAREGRLVSSASAATSNP